MSEQTGERVLLYIYDLSRGLARSLSPSLIGRQIDGIWHTSVVCYGYEFYYGQGIFVTDRVGQTQYGTPVQIEDMGITELPQEVFIEYIDSLRDIYTAEKYHLLDNNCNTFTNDVCQFLVSKTIPGHISSLPEDFLNTPFGQSLRPMIDGAFAGPPPSQSFGHRPNFTSQQQQSPHLSAPQTQQNVHFPTTMASFDALLSSSTMAIAFFTSETCGPCKMIEPRFHSLSKTHTNITFIQIDTQRAFPVAQHYQITATPTFMTFLNGHVEMEWKGANISALESNVSRLLETAKPTLPPTLRGHYSQSPMSFARSPPMQKVIPSLPTGVLPKPLLESISAFLSSKGDTDVLVPPLNAWAACQRELDYGVENAWMITDLLRAAMADRRVSGWFAVDGLEVISDLVKKVAAKDENEWQLRVVTITNVFSTPLLTMASLQPFLPQLVELLTSSILSSSTTSRLNLVKAAAAALFNLSRLSLAESVALGEDEILSVVVALVESLKVMTERKSSETKELERLLVVCIGGYVILGKDSVAIKEVLEGIEAVDIITGAGGSVSNEVIGLIKG